MPAYCHPAAYAAFEREVPHIDSTHGLFRAAFAIARHEHPEADVREAESALQKLGMTIAVRVRPFNPVARLAHLHDLLFDVVGFRGNVEDYYNPANSYLPNVISTHRGLPIVLVLIYKYVAEVAGLTVHGINSPGHFLASVECPEPRTHGWMYVDPFYGGGLLKKEEVFRRIADATGRDDPPSPAWLAPATHRQWLARMLNNLQAVFAHTGRERDLYAMQELQELLT